MNILIVGSGGREQALAWKLAQSKLAAGLWVAPGNAGTPSATSGRGENVPIAAENVPALVDFARANAVDLVVIGPEVSLEAGLADALSRARIRAFGPTQAAARIETSKAFAKEFMRRHQIPTARFARIKTYDEGLAHLAHVDYPVVIKTSGLAAGKGVIVPENREAAEEALKSMLLERVFGSAADEVIIEERLQGEEVSLLAFTDGITVRPMLPAQDHKRLLDGDRGPNTGGMGAYAPAPVCPPEMVDKVARTILQPAVDGLRAEGCPFVGVLYAGLMLTAAGPQVLEFNCRFGDPETQALLPLLDSDLAEILLACCDGRLDQVAIRWQDSSAACVVLASEGYPARPATGRAIAGLDHLPAHALAFHAGTKTVNGETVTAGGRVLSVTGVGQTLEQALASAYRAIDRVHFEGMQYRKDIAAKAFRTAPARSAVSAYARSGVSIDAGNRAVDLMREAVQSTYSPAVLAGIGAFGGLFDASLLKDMRSPALVASTDGVGTKVRLGAKTGRYQGLGEDIVNHCINDILVQGARPLFFLDYFAASTLQPEVTAEVVSGIALACRSAGCALLGGETAEMPGVYASGEFDLAGTIIGVVERESILPRGDLKSGDLLVGLHSSGAHTNGYSLIRRVFADAPLDTFYPELGAPLAEVLLATHRSYLPILWPILERDPSPIRALAHITGGGFLENIPRVLPGGLRAVIHLGSWPVPPLFSLIQKLGGVSAEEMHRVFNMGIGMVVVVSPERLHELQDCIDEETWVIGALEESAKGVTLA